MSGIGSSTTSPEQCIRLQISTAWRSCAFNWNHPGISRDIPIEMDFRLFGCFALLCVISNELVSSKTPFQKMSLHQKAIDQGAAHAMFICV